MFSWKDEVFQNGRHNLIKSRDMSSVKPEAAYFSTKRWREAVNIQDIIIVTEHNGVILI